MKINKQSIYINYYYGSHTGIGLLPRLQDDSLSDLFSSCDGSLSRSTVQERAKTKMVGKMVGKIVVKAGCLASSLTESLSKVAGDQRTK